MTGENIPSWMAFAHAKSFSNKRKMEFLISIVYGMNISLEDALSELKLGNRIGFEFTDKEWFGIQGAVGEIPNYSFLAEKLLDQGIEIVNVMEKYAYPAILKKNLLKDAPILIYTKGNADLLNQNSVAIVGARKSSKISLQFTDRIAELSAKNNSVVVSGFAKGVDKQALDSALKYHGKSIIVLPQGINTYKTKAYYSEIIKGNVLVISTYHPQAPWSVGLAMDRNKIIYGLAEEIYAAESGDSGGTWEGVINGLKRKRRVYVRLASSEEKNANNKLIKLGATPVNNNGEVANQEIHSTTQIQEQEQEYPSGDLSDQQLIEKTIAELRIRDGKGITTPEIVELFKLDKTMKNKLGKILGSSSEIRKEKKGRMNFYKLNTPSPTTGKLF